MARILIADAEINHTRLYKRELERDGDTVIVANSGTEALSKFEEFNPDIVILDIRMPDMDGFELMGRLLDKRRDLPIIINSASRAYQNDYLCWCADTYIIKSSDLSELKSAIRNVITRKSKAA